MTRLLDLLVKAHQETHNSPFIYTMNERGCYCDIWDKDPAFFESQGVPRGYCGFCQTCGQPGHTRHFPGASPYTGCWCDKHYRRLSFIHPLGTYGTLIYSAALLAIMLLVMWWK